MIYRTYQLSLIFLVYSFLQMSNAGIVITSKQNKSTETIIYQEGIAIYLKNGKASSIIDTNTNNCIAINHNLKRYLFLECNEFNSINKLISSRKQKEFNKKIPLVVQEMMTGNLPPKTPISIRLSGRGSYQGFHVEKFKFMVDDEVVSEYWMSGSLEEKIEKEIDINKLENIFNISDKNTIFMDGLDAKIDQKYNSFKEHRFALKEFRYTGSDTKKIYRQIKLKRVKIRKYMPPKDYKNSSSVSEFLH